MTALDLKVGSIIEIPVNYSPERMNIPTLVIIRKATDSYLWFGHSGLFRMGRNTFDKHIKHFGYKIISI